MNWACTVGFNKITPAEQGTIAVAIDDARAQGLGDDATVDHIQSALQSEGMDEKTAADVAYDAWHGRAVG